MNWMGGRVLAGLVVVYREALIRTMPYNTAILDAVVSLWIPGAVVGARSTRCPLFQSCPPALGARSSLCLVGSRHLLCAPRGRIQSLRSVERSALPVRSRRA